MYQIAETIANRLIIFIIGKAKGETTEERLTYAIKKFCLILAASLFINCTLIVSDINNRAYVNDLEESLSKFSFIFDKEDNPLNELIQTNKDLQQRLDVAIKTNISLIKDNNLLSSKVLQLLKDTEQCQKEKPKLTDEIKNNHTND